ncbi:MAG TPA: DUF3187 family protein [Gemmatimonadales bacterium]|nr:DUF3187 family protein [Gemmatimonadales bacterium]
MSSRAATALRLASCVCALACALTPLAAAQGLPSYVPMNPVAVSRSGVYFQPYIDPRPGAVRLGVDLDYASAIEYNIPGPQPMFLLDAELMRWRVSASRDVSARDFLFADATVNGAYNGFLDGFLNWYHNLFGFHMPERELRPDNQFAYELVLPNGTSVQRSRSNLFLGDLRFGFGRRWTPELQTMLAVTLPTATGPAGYGRGTVSVSALNTYRTKLSSRLTFEGGVGLGVTPTHGELALFQRTMFVSASPGLRFRFWGRQSLYATLFYHSPYYHDTQLPALDRHELSLDFGWLLATKHGDWKIGLAEDLQPSGPAIDLIFRFGMTR